METLYKTDKPTDFENGEYYQARLVRRDDHGVTTYVVEEKHGWFSDAEKRPVHHITTLSPEEGYKTYGEAEQAYNERLKHRTKEGFIHSFSIDFFAIGGVVYRRLDGENQG